MRLIEGDRHEAGMAMITVLLVTLVVASLAAVSTQIADHSLTSSAGRRGQVGAVHAAEAGINEALKQMAGPAGAAWCGTAATEATLLPGGGGSPGGGQYSIAVVDSFPSDGNCTPSDSRRIVTATGYSPSAASPRPEVRQMEAEVNLVPQTASPSGYSFDKAIFSNSSNVQLQLHNQGTLLGNGGNNADVYSNKDVTVDNKTTVYGDVLAQGNVILQNNSEVRGDVWAKGNILIDNSALVFGNVVSSRGSVTVKGATVSGYVRAASSITRLNSWKIGGSSSEPCAACYPNSPSADPPAETLPTFEFLPASQPWPQPVTTYSSCDAFLTYLSNNRSDVKGTHRITSNCGLEFTNTWDVTLTGDTAIVHDGWFDFNNKSVWKGGHKLYLVSLCTPTGTTGACSNGEAGVDIRNSSDFSQVKLLIFAMNKVTKRNSGAITGQIYAQRVQIDNQFTLTFHQLTLPGFVATSGGATATSAPTGYLTQLLYLREI